MKQIFLFCKMSRPSPLFNVYPWFFPGGKSDWGVKLTQSPRAEVKNEWNHTATPPICLNGVDWEILFFNFFVK
jgi:hypothetical protein